MLEFTKGLHRINRQRVDFSINNRKHAIYLLQGGILTACSRALDFNQKGYHMSTILHKRMIDETINLIWFFDDTNDTSRHLRAWFRGDVVERKSGKGGELSIEQRAKMGHSSPELIATLDDLFKKMNNETSKYMHPTINIMKSNLLKRTLFFDYDYKTISKPCLSPESFGSFYVIPTLNALRTPMKTLPLLNIDYDRLQKYIKRLM